VMLVATESAIGTDPDERLETEDVDLSFSDFHSSDILEIMDDQDGEKSDRIALEDQDFVDADGCQLLQDNIMDECFQRFSW
jgi:hypothetical protein